MSANDQTEMPGEHGRAIGRAKARAAAAVGRARSSERVQAVQQHAVEAIHRAGEVEALQVAKRRAEDAFDRARESEGVQAARRRTEEALRHARGSDQAQRVGEVVRSAAASDSVTRARAAVSDTTERVRHGELNQVVLSGATNLRAAGRRAMHGQDGRPRSLIALWLALGLAAEGATFLSWLTFHAGPLRHGYSINEVPMLGGALTGLTLTALAFGTLGYCLRRWYCWLLAGATQLIAVVIGTAGLLFAGAVASIAGKLRPSGSETVTTGSASYVFVLAAGLFVGASVWIAVASRDHRLCNDRPAPTGQLPPGTVGDRNS